MKIARILVTLALLVVAAGAANAQQYPGCASLAWNACAPANPNDQPYSPPQVLYKLVISAIGVNQANIGHDTNLVIGPNVPDAWRFDDIGCQTGSQLILSGTSFTKTCPVMKGLNSLPITFYGYDPGTKNCELRLGVTYDAIAAPVAATRYTLWQVTFDHTYSSALPTDPGNTCGEADQGLNLDLGFCQMLQTNGYANFIPVCPSDARCTWAGGPVVPTIPASWGKVKGLYR